MFLAEHTFQVPNLRSARQMGFSFLRDLWIKASDMNEVVIDIIGWYGIVAVLLAFALTSWGVIPQGWISNLLNFTGAIAIVVQTAWRGVYQPAVLNVIWTLIALAAMIRLLRTKRGDAEQTPEVNTIVVPIRVEGMTFGPDGERPMYKIFHVAVLTTGILVVLHGVVTTVFGESAGNWMLSVLNGYGLFALALLAALNVFLTQNQLAAISWGVGAVEELTACTFLRLIPTKRITLVLMHRRQRLAQRWQTCRAYWKADTTNCGS